MQQLAALEGLHAAIDFGTSNTDVVVVEGGALRTWSQPYRGDPDKAGLAAILAAGHVDLNRLDRLVVTGGRHLVLPERLGSCQVVKVNEVKAIGRGGQAMAELSETARKQASLVVSSGSGTAMIRAQGNDFLHASGTGVGGGTMLGLGRLLLDTTDPVEIGALAARGDRNAVDLTLADVVLGPIGTLPAEATAVNFGKVGRQGFQGRPRPQDLAAALVNLVAQTTGLIALNAAQAHGCSRIIVTGHMLDIPAFRALLAPLGQFYGMPVHLPENAGYATALGGLLVAQP